MKKIIIFLSVLFASFLVVLPVKAEEASWKLFGDEYKYCSGENVRNTAVVRYAGSRVYYKLTKYAPRLISTGSANDEDKEIPTQLAKDNLSLGKYAINGVTSVNFPVFDGNTWIRKSYKSTRPYYDSLLLTKNNQLASYKNGTDLSVMLAKKPAWIAGGFDLLISGGKVRKSTCLLFTHINEDIWKVPNEKQPRTFIGQLSDDTFFFGVVAGRGKDGNSAGMTYAELIDFVVKEIADDDIKKIDCLFNLDGGGTSTFIYKGVRATSTYTGFKENHGDPNYERKVNSIFVFKK